MKIKLAVLLVMTTLCTACCTADNAVDCEEDAEVIVLGSHPANTQSVIFLINQTTGELACCRDTAISTAEECAHALEQECFKRVEDIPYGKANYDFLKAGTYPTRRWRNGESNPRW